MAQDDDDDDFVIQAGSREASPRASSLQSERSASGALGSEASADVRCAADVAEGRRSIDEYPDADRRDQKGYRETTIEDLEAEPMPVMQKAVIFVALLLIAGCIAYYIFMR